MSGNAFASDFPGRGAWGPRDRHDGPHHHHHRHGCGSEGGRRDRAELESALRTLAGWVYTKARSGPGRPGRPSPEDIENLIALRKMRGGPFGAESPFGPGPWGRGPGPGGGRGRGRGRARRGDVRLALLRLLAEEPRNGYQLMQTIEERSGGRWRPSPGSVYPTLAQLEDEGLVRSREADGARHFEITESGRTHLGTRDAEPDPWASSDEDSESVLMELGPLVLGIGKAAWQVASVGDETQRSRATEVLAETRRKLYGILAAESDAADEDDGAATGESDA